MSDASRVPLEDRLSPFQIATHTYKIVEDTPILVDVLIPKKLVDADPASETRKGKQPVIIRIHGGWLIAGQRDFAPWFAAWALELALKHDAIIVNTDYRLLPEVTTAEEILDDIDDLWKWVGRDLQNVIHERESCKGLNIDLDKVVVYGESAGGYLSVQTALTHFDQNSNTTIPRIRAVIAAYPMLDFRSPYWTTDYHKEIFGAPQIPNSFIDEFLASVANAPKRTVASNATVVDSPRMQFAFALVQRGRFLEVLGADRDPTPGKRRLHPEDRIVDGRKLPPTLFIHGADDSAVPVAGTEKFVRLLRTHNAVHRLAEGKDENEVLKLVVVPGDHGFDSDLHTDSEEWMKDNIAFVEKHWLE